MFKTLLLCSLSIVLGAGLLLAHGDATHLMGTVSSIDTAKNIFVIKQSDGKTVSVMTDKFTKYLKNDKPTPSSELKVGVRVVIDAKMDKTAKMFVAEEVRVGVAAPAAAAAKTAGATKAAPQKAAPSKP